MTAMITKSVTKYSQTQQLEYKNNDSREIVVSLGWWYKPWNNPKVTSTKLLFINSKCDMY